MPHAEPGYNERYYVRKSSYHFCGNWCGIDYSLPNTPWISSQQEILDFRFYSKLSSTGRSAYRTIHRRHNYLHDVVLAKLCFHFPCQPLFYLKDYVMRLMNITQHRLVLAGVLPIISDLPQTPHVFFDVYFPKPTKIQYLHYPNSLRYPIPGFD